MSPVIIKWPDNNLQTEIIDGFDNLGFPNTIGAIDGSYIPISVPGESSESYFCRKGFAAIILQV